MNHTPIHVTLYSGIGPTPIRQDDFEGGWPEFTASMHDLIDTLPRAPDAAPAKIQKETLYAWSPHRLAKPYRHEENVQELTLLVIDVDRCDLAALCDGIEAMGWATIIYSSPSDSDDLPSDARRVRVVSPVSRPIRPGECEQLRFAYAEALGLKPGQGVEGAKDPTKIFFAGRLHGSDERLWAEAEGAAVDVDDLLQLELTGGWTAPSRTREAPRDQSGEVDRRQAKVKAVLKHCSPAVEGLEGHRDLYVAACEAASVLGEDSSAVAQALADYYNPRCIPAWDDKRIQWEAKRAVERIATPEERYGRRIAERDDAHFADGGAMAAALGESDELGRIVDWSTPVQPLRYLCEGLGIGWVGKCAGVHGYAGTSKGLFVARLLLSAAAGKPFLGHEVRRVPVVYCDAETGAIAENRIKRLAIAMGIDLGELAAEGWWTFRHVSAGIADLIESGALERACQNADKGEGVVLGIDSYSSMVGGDENDSEYADPLWALGRLGQAVNALPIVVMHDRKGTGVKGAGNPLEGVSGTNRLAAALASSIRLTPNEDNDRVITVACTRAPERRFEPIELTWKDVDGGGIAAECEALQLETKQERTAARAQVDAERRLRTISKRADAVESLLRGVIADNMTARKVRSTIPMNGDDWLDVRRELLRRGSVTENKAGHFPTYRLSNISQNVKNGVGVRPRQNAENTAAIADLGSRSRNSGINENRDHEMYGQNGSNFKRHCTRPGELRSAGTDGSKSPGA